MAPHPWIAEVWFSPEVADKIQSKHHLTPREVEEAVRLYAGIRARWHDHPVHGRRLIVIGETFAGLRIIAILRQIDQASGTWECRTARRTRK